MTRRCARGPVLLAMTFAVGGAAAAAPPPAPPAPAVAAVLACREIHDDAKRLACFDSATASMGEAERKGDLLTLDREQRRAVRRQAFGLSLPSFTLFDKGEKPEEANRITAKIASARRNSGGKWVFGLDDGAVWRQIDDTELNIDPRPGDQAVVSRGALGSYFLTLKGQGAMRVHRDA